MNKVKRKTIRCKYCNKINYVTAIINEVKREERANLIKIIDEIKKSKSPYYKYLKQIGMSSSHYQLKLFKKRGYKTHYEYQNELAKKHGYKSRWYYTFEKFSKKHGYKRPIDLRNAEARRRGFANYFEYENHLLKKRGFKDRNDYRRYMTKKKREMI